MCGINGILVKSDDLNIRGILTKMNNKIIHRGPDDEGYLTEIATNYSIGMSMRRLAVLDILSGQQPIYSNDKQKVIVYNGEIYNHQSLKNILKEKGYQFSTKSDTEIIVNLYDCFGTESFSMLDGMFAFSIYDKTIDKLFIVRDFFGEKPLYYSVQNDRIIWASELKSIVEVFDYKPEINRTALNIYLQLTYIPAPYSIFENIFKLEPNKFIEIDCNTLKHSVNEIKHSFKKYKNLSKKDAVKMTHDFVQDSILSRSRADVPIGTFLSGGVDSSIVSLCLAQQSDEKIDTFSIGFEKKAFDESDKSKEVAKLINSNHHEFIVSEKSLRDNLSEILLNFDEPFADSSSLASYIVANKTKNYATVALTGDGGDEVFGGYNKYYMGRLNQKYTSIVPYFFNDFLVKSSDFLLRTKDDNRGKRFKLKRFLKAINYEGDFYYNIISLGFQANEVATYLKSKQYLNNSLAYYKGIIGDNNKTLTDFRNIDKIISLEGDMLVKVDRTSMLTSLECRAPFLNKEIWNFTSQLPENYLISGWDKKHILKEAFKDYFPKNFLDKSKKGFGVPVGDWLRTDLKEELTSLLVKNLLKSRMCLILNQLASLYKII